MAVPVGMPKLGMTMREGRVVAWPVALGGRVEKGAPVVVIESEKAEVEVEGKAARKIKLKLKYEGRKSVIEGLRRVSTPGLRRYVRSTEIPRVRGGLGISVISTPQGVMTGTQARKNNLGGELICYVW